MGFTFLMALICATIPARTLRSLGAGSRRAVPQGFAWSCTYVVALDVLLLLQLALLEQRQAGAFSSLPHLGAARSAVAFGALSVLETALLACLYVSLDSAAERRRDAVLVASGAAVMLLAGLGYRNTGGDVLAYVGSALLAHPYAPEHVRFSGDFAVINRLWRYPLLPSPYGPVWIALSRLLVAPGASLRGAVLGFQLVEAAALLAMVVALRRWGVRPATVAVLALNPFVLQTYVAEGHNDLVASALVLAAGGLWAPLAVLAVVAAGGMKISLAALGLCAFARFEAARTRVLCAMCVVAGSAAVWAWAGPDYLRAIRTTTNAYWQPLPPAAQLLHVACAAVAIALVACGLAGRRLPPGGAWCGIALGQYPLYNYLAWGIPYAAAADALALFLIALPYAGFEATNVFVATPFSNALRAGAASLLGIAVYLSVRGLAQQLRERRL